MVEDNFQEEWRRFLTKFSDFTGKTPTDLNPILLLIGIQELGKGHRYFSKEEKQDLLHIAVCKLMSYAGYYTFEGFDKDGWPHWRLVKKIPYLNLQNQEEALKRFILEYFKKEVGWEW
ncbi:MAG: hypothetical protein NZM38_07250 [Cytophagales bacterium]|nr:hypothetical protein [Cytophagales bacterium]MDW8384553.1 hypothetical protein [Flammeovirgaceae bacterium]